MINVHLNSTHVNRLEAVYRGKSTQTYLGPKCFYIGVKTCTIVAPALLNAADIP
jgi:hypothetical protein